jgi:hypothetical protein
MLGRVICVGGERRIDRNALALALARLTLAPDRAAPLA